jgi:hypothetical protein
MLIDFVLIIGYNLRDNNKHHEWDACIEKTDIWACSLVCLIWRAKYLEGWRIADQTSNEVLVYNCYGVSCQSTAHALNLQVFRLTNGLTHAFIPVKETLVRVLAAHTYCGVSDVCYHTKLNFKGVHRIADRILSTYSDIVNC